MKKILIASASYGVLVLLQLISGVVALVTQSRSLGMVLVQTVLLMGTGAALTLSEYLLRHDESALEESTLGILYVVQKQVSLVLSGCVLNLVLTAIRTVWPLPMGISLAVLIYFLAVITVSVIQLYRAIQANEQMEQTQDAELPFPEGPAEEMPVFPAQEEISAEAVETPEQE